MSLDEGYWLRKRVSPFGFYYKRRVLGQLPLVDLVPVNSVGRNIVLARLLS